MSQLEIIMWVTISTLIIAFIIKVFIETAKFIYAIAPSLLILLLALVFLYSTNSDQVRKEINHANYIESVKDKGKSNILP